MVQTNSIKQIPEGEQWDAEFVRTIRGTPWDPEPSKTGEERRRGEREEEEAEHELPPVPLDHEERAPERRAMKITRRILQRFGETPGCAGCQAMSRGTPAGSRLHAEACRLRIENEVMAESNEARARVEEMRARRTYQPASSSVPVALPGPVASPGPAEPDTRPAARKRDSEEQEEPEEPAARRRRTAGPEEPPDPAALRTTRSWQHIADGQRVDHEGDLDMGMLDDYEAEELLNVFETLEGTRPTEVGPRKVEHKHLLPGFVLDLTKTDEQGKQWNFHDAEDRQRVRAMVKYQRPWLLVASPIDGEATRSEVERMVHSQFCVELYKSQEEAGRLYLHEHPVAMLDDRVMEEFTKTHSSEWVLAAQRTGVMKPTMWMTNSGGLSRVLSEECEDLDALYNDDRSARERTVSKLDSVVLRGLRDELRMRGGHSQEGNGSDVRGA